MPGKPASLASQPSPGVARQMAMAQSAPTRRRPSASTPCSRRRTSASVAPKRESASGSRLISRNSITPARAARTSRLRCQSMPALQTGHLVLYQTVSCGRIAGASSSTAEAATIHHVRLRTLKGPAMIDAAVIGLGRWGKSIVEAAQGKSKRLRFIRGVSKEPELVADFAKTHGFELGTEFADIIADPCVRAVVLATPHSLHVEQIVAAAAAGKAIWCEKPLALTRADAARAIAAVTKAGVAFGLGNNKRCFASMRELKQIVAAGVLGEVLHIEGHFSNEHSTR